MWCARPAKWPGSKPRYLLPLMPPVLAGGLCRNLNQTFQTAKGPLQVLMDVNLEIARGDFVAVIGRSGAGKSTFLRTLNGLLIPTSGSVVVNGTDITKLTKRELQRYRRTVGFIFQQFNLVNRLSALDNVLHGRLGYLPTWRGLLGLYSVDSLSGGSSNGWRLPGNLP